MDDEDEEVGNGVCSWGLRSNLTVFSVMPEAMGLGASGVFTRYCRQDDAVDDCIGILGGTGERRDCRNSCLREGEVRERIGKDVEVRKHFVVLERSPLDYREHMGHLDCDPQEHLEVAGSSSSLGKNESHWDGPWMVPGYHKSCTSLESMAALPLGVVRLPSRPSYGLDVSLPHGLQDQQHPPQLLSLLLFLPGSCFGYGCGFDCGVVRPRKTRNPDVVYDALEGEPQGQCKSDRHRTLLEQVHSLYFRAYYGFDFCRSGGRALTLILTASATSSAMLP